MKSTSNLSFTLVVVVVASSLLIMVANAFTTTTTRGSTSTRININTMQSLSFIPNNHIQSVSATSTSTATSTAIATALKMTTTGNKGEASGAIRNALKKMRGVSVSVEFKPTSSYDSTSATDSATAAPSNMEMEILSQGLRQSKAASIWTSSLGAIEQFAKEQDSAKGNFPGPIPIVFVYYGADGDNGDDGCNADNGNIQAAVEKGATAIVVDVDNLDQLLNVEANNVDIIAKVKDVQQVHLAIEKGYEYAFLIADTGIDAEIETGTESDAQMQLLLNAIPKSAIVICSLACMQAGSQEIGRAKELEAMVGVGVGDNDNTTGAKIAAVLIQNACVGDAEDLRYTAFVVEGIHKKTSRNFSMTGLTGGANGHFGSEQSGGLKSAKWKRMEVAAVSVSVTATASAVVPVEE